jgi:hypothetical protein
MKNRSLAHLIITRQHSGGGTMLAGAYVTRQHKWKHLCWRVPGALYRPPTLCHCKIKNHFKAIKHCQIKKL